MAIICAWVLRTNQLRNSKPGQILPVTRTFVDPEHDDFRLRLDTPLLKVGHFPYLGALAPVPIAAR